MITQDELNIYGSGPDGCGCVDVGIIKFEGYTLIRNEDLDRLKAAAAAKVHIGWQNRGADDWVITSPARRLDPENWRAIYIDATEKPK